MTVKEKAENLNKVFDMLPTGNGIDDETRVFLANVLEDMQIKPERWPSLLEKWYDEQVYVSVRWLDELGRMRLKITFRLYLIGEIQKIYDAEFKELLAVHGGH